MPKPEPRVFLDSNVIFSGLYSSRGAPGIILEHFIKGRITVVVSRQVLEEVIRTIREKFPDALPALRRLLINTPPEVVPDPKLSDIERWTNELPLGDAAILTAAVSAQPDCLVTGDSHFFENPDLSEVAGLKIITPAQFLNVMGNIAKE